MANTTNMTNNQSSQIAGSSRQKEVEKYDWSQGSNESIKELLQNNRFYLPPQEKFTSEEMRGTVQKTLSENIGEYIVGEFLIGTDLIMRKQGVLVHVGRTFITIYDDQSDFFITCDIFSIKFVYFYQPGKRPQHNFNHLRDNQQRRLI